MKIFISSLKSTQQQLEPVQLILKGNFIFLVVNILAATSWATGIYARLFYVH